MNATDLSRLEGSIVLVCSAQDHRNPPSGRRGTIHVRDESAHPTVEIELEFPQMFTTRAHRRTIVLSEGEVAELLASEQYGAFSVTLSGRLEPEASPGNE